MKPISDNILKNKYKKLILCKAKFTAQTLFACCQILFGMHSGFVRDFTNDWQLISEEDVK